MRFNSLSQAAEWWRPAMLRCTAGWALLGLCSACSTVVDVRPLATGRVDVSAFDLRGPTLPALRDQASQLCPQGAEVLRQAARDQLALVDPGRINRWLNTASSWFDPPQREAQLMIVCKPAPGEAQLQATASPQRSKPVSDLSPPATDAVDFSATASPAPDAVPAPTH